MVIKVYVSLISCSQEIKKNQQRTIMILESKNIPYVAVDITDPSQEEAKDYVVKTAIPKPNAKVPVTPQIFNEADYCGDFDQLDMANECDTLGDFLKLSDDEKKLIKIGITGILPDERLKAAQKPPTSEAPLLTNGVNTAHAEASANAESTESAATPATEVIEATEAPALASEAPSEAVLAPAEAESVPAPASEAPEAESTPVEDTKEEPAAAPAPAAVPTPAPTPAPAPAAPPVDLDGQEEASSGEPTAEESHEEERSESPAVAEELEREKATVDDGREAAE